MDQQAHIWKIFQRHQTIPDNIRELHFHIDNFKSNIKKEFTFLKKATRENIDTFQSSLNLQQTYSAALSSHVNNIYNKLAEIQQQLPHSNPHINTGDVIQIEAPDFDPDIDEALPTSTDQHANDPGTQGSVISTQKSTEKMTECRTPAPSHQNIGAQEVEIPELIDRDTGKNGEINAEHYIQYHDELETIPEEEEDKDPQMTAKEDVDQLDTISYAPEESDKEPFNTTIDDTSEDPTIVMGKPVTTTFISDDVRIPTEKVGCLQVTSQLQEFLNHFPPESKEYAFEQIYKILQVLDAYLIDKSATTSILHVT